MAGVYSSGEEGWGPVYKWLCIRAPPAPRPLLLSPGWFLWDSFKNAMSGLHLPKFSLSPGLHLAVSCNPVLLLGVVKACLPFLWLREHAVTHPVAADSRSRLSRGSGGPTSEIGCTEQKPRYRPCQGSVGSVCPLGFLSEAASCTFKANSLASSDVSLLRLSLAFFFKNMFY